jgi:putative ABC transport system permease protein
MEIRPIFSALLRNKTAPLLVAIQVAISLAILANAMYIVQLRIAAAERPSGIADENNVIYYRVTQLQKQSHNETLAQQDRDLATLRAVPGVLSASWTAQMPMSTSGSNSSVRTKPDQVQSTADASTYWSGPGLIKTLGLQLIEGRDFTEEEVVPMDPEVDSWRGTFPKIAIITRELGKVLFPGADQFLGRTFYFGVGDEAIPVRVIGTVERLQTTGAQNSIKGEYSVLMPRRMSQQSVRLAARVEPGQRDRVLAAGEQALRKASTRPVYVSPRSPTEDRYKRYRNERALAWMLIAVSALLLLVTLSGIVGMTALRVAQRRKQIGVRRALGARWRDIVRYFVTENLLITTGGIVAGLFLAVGLNQFLISQFEMSRLPIHYLAYGAGALWLLGIAAVWGPASRAASISPAIATRTA